MGRLGGGGGEEMLKRGGRRIQERTPDDGEYSSETSR